MIEPIDSRTTTQPLLCITPTHQGSIGALHLIQVAQQRCTAPYYFTYKYPLSVRPVGASQIILNHGTVNPGLTPQRLLMRIGGH